MDLQKIQGYASDYWRYVRTRDDRAVNSLIELYKTGKDAPSLTRLIMRDESLKSIKHLYDGIEMDTLQMGAKNALKKYMQGISNQANYSKEIDNMEAIKPHFKDYVKSFKEMYPKTWNLRIHLANADRVSMERVTPKMSFLQKLLKWRKAVPKEVTMMFKKLV